MRTIAIVSLLGVPALAQSYVVSPAQYARHEATTSNAFPFNGVFHYQQAHGDLKGTVRAFKGLAWRRDGEGGNNTTHVAHTLDLEAFLCDTTYSTFSTVFASNYVGTPQLVFTRKIVNAPDWTALPDAAPAPFTLSIAFDTQYVFLGIHDLLWEVVVYASSSTTQYQADATLPSPNFIQGGFTSAGTGCTTTNGIMKLRAYETNNIGTGRLTVNWDIAGGPAKLATAVLVGLTDPNVPLPGLCGSGVVHTDALVWTYNGTTTNPGAMTTTNLSVPWNPFYTGLILTAQAVSLDPSQGGLGLAISNGVASEAPGVPVAAPVMRAYSGNLTATNGVASMTPGLITRFTY